VNSVDLTITGPKNTTLRSRIILGKAADLPEAVKHAMEAFLKVHGSNFVVPITIQADTKNGGQPMGTGRRRRLRRGFIPELFRDR
jgi:hypothetical protein